MADRSHTRLGLRTCYGLAMAACGRGSLWTVAMSLVRQMGLRSLKPEARWIYSGLPSSPRPFSIRT